MKLKIKEFHKSQNGRFVLGRTNLGEIFIWDFIQNKLIDKIKLSYITGGHRLAIDNKGKYIAAVMYSESIVLYYVKTGELVWSLNEIDNIQEVHFIDDMDILAVTSSYKNYWVNINGGDIFGCIDCSSILDIYKDIRIILRNDNEIVCNNALIKFDGLCLAGVITPEGFCISKVGGGLYFYNFKGEQIWYQENIKNEHFVKLVYMEKLMRIVGIIYKYDAPRTEPFYRAICIDIGNGKILCEGDLDNGVDFEFINSGERILSTTRKLYLIEKDRIIEDGFVNLRKE